MSVQLLTETKLSTKQEAFCVFYFISKKPGESYIQAGYSPNFASENAANLLKNTKVQERLAQLQASIPPTEAQAIAIVSERLRLLTEIARHGIETPVSPGHKIMAVAEINKMLGDYAPERHAFIGEVTLRIVEDNDDSDRRETTKGTNNTYP